LIWGSTVRAAPNLREALKIAYADRKDHGSQILLQEYDGTVLVGPIAGADSGRNTFLPSSNDKVQVTFSPQNDKLIGIIGRDSVIQMNPNVSLARPRFLDTLLGGEAPKQASNGNTILM
jgi:hypothetical protein